MRLRMIPILFTKLNSQTNPIPPQSYPTPIPTMHHDPYVDNSLLGYKTNMNVNHYTSHSYNRTVFRYKYIYLYYITTVLEYIQYEVGIKYKYYIGTYGLKWIFFIQMGYLELQRYDKKVDFVTLTVNKVSLRPPELLKCAPRVNISNF